jgi:hypothetical protein
VWLIVACVWEGLRCGWRPGNGARGVWKRHLLPQRYGPEAAAAQLCLIDTFSRHSDPKTAAAPPDPAVRAKPQSGA